MKLPVKPIRPDEVRIINPIPDKVIEAFNMFIARTFVVDRAIVYQDDIVKQVESVGISREDLFENRWLNVEDLYRAEGWIVEYDKPGFNESYPATFTFKVKPQSMNRAYTSGRSGD